MGLRVRKSFKVANGVKVNVGKKSAGISVGGKGAKVSLNSSGRKTTTVGIPGSGVSYTSTSGSTGGKNKKKKSSNAIDNSYEDIYEDDTDVFDNVEPENIQVPPKVGSVIFKACGIFLIIAGLLCALIGNVIPCLIFIALGVIFIKKS